MKALLIKSSVLLVISSCFVGVAQAQEYDDIYFRKSDRVKPKELHAEESPTYGRDSYLYDEIDKLEGENNDKNLLSEYRQNNQSSEYIDESDESTIVEKHYYYNTPTSRYDRSFDDIFWSDPYLYQGTVFDPNFNYYGNRSSYWRPGWNVSISFGNRWNRSRWRSRYWDRYDYGGYNNYAYYGNSWNYGYYNNYWCPPNYSNRGNVIVYNNRSGVSRGITRGRRYSRNSSINNNSRDSGRTGRINIGGSSFEDKENRGGRYSGDSRTYRNSSQTYNRDESGSTPRRRSSSNNGNARTYPSENNTTNRSNSRSNTYRSGSRSSSNNNRSSSGSNTYRRSSGSSSSSGSRSSSSTRSSSSSSNSKSSSSSRSSRTKKGN